MVYQRNAVDLAIAGATRDIHGRSLDVHRRSVEVQRNALDLNRSVLTHLYGGTSHLESHVTLDGVLHVLPNGFFHIAVDGFRVVAGVAVVLLKCFSLLVVVVVPVAAFLALDGLVVLIPDRADARSIS